jgi:FkbM family methyltransferase
MTEGGADTRQPPPATGNATLVPRLQRRLNKPYFVLRPTQIVRRALLPIRQRRLSGEYDEITLPWGHPLRFRANEKTGLCWARRGIFDLPVCEALWRLVDRGELALDVGANIGQMTSVLSAALGSAGRVIAFEPHPEVFRLLSENASRWSTAQDTAVIELRNQGASSSAGVADLAMNEAFTSNSGTASMAGGTQGYAVVESIMVPVLTLDEAVADMRIGVMKLDVEGYELEVLRGATRLLEEQRIRDIVFEEFDEPPTPVTSMLEGFGYAVYSLDQALLGPVAAPAGQHWEHRSTEDPSYLATTEPQRALERLRARGWGVLGVGPHARRRQRKTKS